MWTSQVSEATQPHIALFPSAGMGHLTPFLRLASMLLSHNCMVTLITTKSAVSVAESTYVSFFLSTHPQINHIEFQVPQLRPSNTTSNDPFFIQFEATSRSAHLVQPLISSLSPPLSAIFSDLVVLAGMNKVAANLGIPNYTVSTTSVKFLSLMAYLPALISDVSASNEVIEIPGLTPLPRSSIPPFFFNPDHLFTATLVSNARALPDSEGILMNTFDSLEPETIAAINNKRSSALSNLPLILPIGPLQTYEVKKDNGQYLPWLNNQPAKTVVFVSFGSRTAMSVDQIRELRDGLEKSEHGFLWVVKTKKVDKDESNEELEDLLSSSFLERTRNKGMVIKGWVNQQEILAHPAIGGFVSHCGWNSVMEAAQRGIPMLAWPLHGDQRVNAEVLEKAGLGIWDKTWGWGGQRLVKHDEIQTMISQLMTDEKLKSRARKVGEEAREATGNGGSSMNTIIEVIELLKQNKRRRS